MTQDGINFNNVKDGGKVQSSSPIWTGQVGVDEFGGVINAVDIDWNGAEVGTINGVDFGTIKTTGKLLKERIQHNSPIFARVA